jgi:hypothetical protein
VSVAARPASQRRERRRVAVFATVVAATGAVAAVGSRRARRRRCEGRHFLQHGARPAQVEHAAHTRAGLRRADEDLVAEHEDAVAEAGGALRERARGQRCHEAPVVLAAGVAREHKHLRQAVAADEEHVVAELDRRPEAVAVRGQTRVRELLAEHRRTRRHHLEQLDDARAVRRRASGRPPRPVDGHVANEVAPADARVHGRERGDLGGAVVVVVAPHTRDHDSKHEDGCCYDAEHRSARQPPRRVRSHHDREEIDPLHAHTGTRTHTHARTLTHTHTHRHAHAHAQTHTEHKWSTHAHAPHSTPHTHAAWQLAADRGVDGAKANRPTGRREIVGRRRIATTVSTRAARMV